MVSGDTPTLRLEQNGSSGFAPQTWDVAGNETSFFIRDASNGSTLPLRIRPGAPSQSLVVDTEGDVGVGVLSTDDVFDGRDSSLHIRRTDGDASLLVEEASGTDTPRVLMELKNNGSVRMNLTDTSTGTSWRHTVNNAGQFGIIIEGAGDGMVLDTDGSATFDGDVTANGVLLTSDRNRKTDIVPVDAESILGRIGELPIAQWSWKGDDTAVRHLGPMAQDFAAAFGLGDSNTTINVLDAAGVSLAAVQALHHRAETKEAELDELRVQYGELAARYDELAARLAALESE